MKATPDDGKKKQPNDQRDGEMAQWVQAASAHVQKGMNLEELHAEISERNSKLLDTFDQFLASARKRSDEAAEEWKNNGRDKFKAKQWENGVLCYTRALHEATEQDKQAILITNRATCLHHMELYPQSVADSTAALERDASYKKAHYRRGQTLKTLGYHEAGDFEVLRSQETEAAAAELTEEAVQKGTTALDAALADLDAKIKQNGVAGDPTAPKATEAHPGVQVVYTPETGRKLVARSVIEAGEVLIAEDAFAAALRPEHLLTHCDWCLQHTPNLYPSKQFQQRSAYRSRGLYCSAACESHAWQLYGCVEAKHPFFLICPLDVLVATRMVLARHASQKSAAVNPFRESEGSWEVPKGGLYSADFIDSLEGHTHETEQTLSVGGMESAAVCLMYHSGALASLVMKCENVEQVPVPTLWLYGERVKRSMQQIVTNGVGVSKILRLPAPSAVTGVHSLEHRKVATAVFPAVALANHTCDPNAFLNFLGGPHAAYRRVFLRATRPIAAGEEIAICYGPHKNKIHSTKNRREALQNQYNFLCHCKACLEEKDDVVSEEKQEIMMKASAYYQKGRKMMREGRHEDAIPALQASLDMLLNEVFIGKHRTSFVVGKTYDALAECYAMKSRYKEAMKQCKLSLESTIYVHGENEIEVAHEYLKLSGLAAQVGDFEEAEQMADKAATIFAHFYGPAAIPEVDECREAAQVLRQQASG
ncbi:hypothetical protein DIPPA_06895 [Diplonema papillatum]|nr:hypothetical protein DIPPA_06895 [Diplonema papillatum]